MDNSKFSGVDSFSWEYGFNPKNTVTKNLYCYFDVHLPANYTGDLKMSWKSATGIDIFMIYDLAIDLYNGDITPLPAKPTNVEYADFIRDTVFPLTYERLFYNKDAMTKISDK